jgi:hypothetical protein
MSRTQGHTYCYHYTKALVFRQWQSSAATTAEGYCVTLMPLCPYTTAHEATSQNTGKLYWCQLVPRISEYSWCERYVFVTVT